MGKRVGDRGVNSWLGGGDFLAGAVTGSIASAFGGAAGGAFWGGVAEGVSAKNEWKQFLDMKKYS